MNKTRCIHCGKEFEYSGFCCPTMCNECNKKWLEMALQPISSMGTEATSVKVSIATRCIICGESVELTDMEEEVSRYNTVVKVCEECKQAVMKMREKLDKDENTSVPNNICDLH